MKYLISIHSVVDLITNSSTEIFLIDQPKEKLDLFYEIVEAICVSPNEIDWLNRECQITWDEEECAIRLYSFLNMPDCVDSFLEMINAREIK